MIEVRKMQNYEELLEKLNARIWDCAELKFEEYQSAEALKHVMEEHGFSVESGAGRDGNGIQSHGRKRASGDWPSG